MVVRSRVGPVMAVMPLPERGDDDLVFVPQEAGEPGGREPHELDVRRHALAAVDQQREGRGRSVRHHQVDRLRLAVLPQDELRRVEPADIASAGVLHRRVDADAA